MIINKTSPCHASVPRIHKFDSRMKVCKFITSMPAHVLFPLHTLTITGGLQQSVLGFTRPLPVRGCGGSVPTVVAIDGGESGPGSDTD